MKCFNYIEMRVFSKQEDNEEKIKGKIREIFPFEKLNLSEKLAVGFDEKKIKIINVKLTKASEISGFIKAFFSRFNDEQKNLILRQLDSRIDDNLRFYLRLDKNKLLENLFWITDGGNCFHFTISILAYPHTKEKAKEVISNFII